MITPGEEKAMFNLLQFLWSQVGYDWERLTNDEKRLMSKRRFEKIVGVMVNRDVNPNSRIAVMVKDVPAPVAVEAPEPVAVVVQVPIDFVEKKAVDKEALLRQLIELLG